MGFGSILSVNPSIVQLPQSDGEFSRCAGFGVNAAAGKGYSFPAGFNHVRGGQQKDFPHVLILLIVSSERSHRHAARVRVRAEN